MKNYPRLAEMGVKNPLEIEKFAVYSTESLDTLHIIYKRKKGSLLPVSRKYKFPRAKKSIMVNSATRQTNVVFESSSALLEAMGELEQIRAEHKDSASLSAAINDELTLLEDEVKMRTEYIRSLIAKL